MGKPVLYLLFNFIEMKENITNNQHIALDLIKRQKNLNSITEIRLLFLLRDYCTASDGFT